MLIKSLTDQIVSDPSLPAFFPIFQHLHFGDLAIKQDECSGLLAIVAIHSTELGPALGGCRFRHYNTLDEAIIDALRLAHGMSYKAAVSGLALGGGKAVLIRPPGIINREPLFQAFGHFVQTFEGRYITAEDSGTSVQDMDTIKSVTPYVVGHSSTDFIHQDPSILTALGVRRGIEAAVKYQTQRDSLSDIHVAIQGLGHVGYALAKELFQAGAKLTVCDINPDHEIRCKEEFRASIVGITAIHQVECDIYAPCALSNAITQQNIHEIKAKIIAGCANNQLESPELALRLKEKGILYAPDYVINAGGLIHVFAQYYHHSEKEASEKINHIYDTLMAIFEMADKENTSTLAVANHIAELKLHSK